MSETKEIWHTIEDDKLKHVWVRPDHCKCEDEGDKPAEDNEIHVSPNYYGTEGTPTGNCGCDWEYSHTIVSPCFKLYCKLWNVFKR